MDTLLAMAVALAAVAFSVCLTLGAIGEHLNMPRLSNPVFRKIRGNYTDKAYEDRVKWNLILTLPLCYAAIIYAVFFQQ
jgi:hypothetical protein